MAAGCPPVSDAPGYGADADRNAILRAMASSGRRWVLPSILAVVVLGLLSSIIGWQLGTREGKNIPLRTIGGPSASAPSSQDPTGPAAKACPDATVAAAQAAGGVGAITQVRYVRTKSADVWICNDTAGRLFYQGHVGATNRDFDDASNGQNTLFLTNVVANDNTYVATNTGGSGSVTTYSVSKNKLVVVRDGETIVNEDVQTFE